VPVFRPRRRGPELVQSPFSLGGAEKAERLRFQLADTLPGYPFRGTDFFKRMFLPVNKSVP
jgi:hypothetical protein